MTESLQEKMFQDMERKEIFSQAQSYAFEYADHAFERNVFPTDEAIKNLGRFNEDLPDVTGKAAEIWITHDKVLPRTTIPLRSIATSKFCR